MLIGTVKKQNEEKMRKKVLNVSYRKDSNTFSDWMKYEIEILKEDGTREKIPAYGKDLQDALSRVVHDEKVEKIEEKTKRIPDLVWIVLWFGYIFGLAELSMSLGLSNLYKSIVFVSGLTFITGLTLWAKAWFRMRNKDK